MSGLRRALGFGSLSFYGIGLILGAGVYSILGEAAGAAGSALWLAFLLGSVVALLTGLSYAELATMHPKAGAEYVYLEEAWPKASWLRAMVGWTLAAAGTAMAATVALAFAGYASLFVGAPAWILALALLAAVGVLNVVGIREAAWANVLFTLAEAAGLVALIVVGATRPGFGEAFLAAPHPGVLAGAGLVFFAFLGFEDVANLAEEARRPGRDLPRAILTAVGVSSALYVLTAAASVALLDPARLAGSPSPLADAMREGAPALAGALGGVALFATANTALISVTAVSRLLFGMARGGDAPPALARTLPRRATPALGVAAACAGAAA
ncbi:MAG TPA: APC family permease, partial [Candidatus Thermoplasmatota archaeon]|nr:APC family permease [Candidatus Thermoplasmatota archaeon]